MPADHDHERIAKKAFEIWESEGHPHGRDQAHWDQAKEIVALHDSMGDTLLPRETGAFEPEEPSQAVEANGDIPGLSDQGRDDLIDTDREPENTKPSHAVHSLGQNAGHVARSRREETPDIDDGETVTPAPKVQPVTPTPSNPMLGEPAPRPAVAANPATSGTPVPKTASVPPKPGTGATVPGTGSASASPVRPDAKASPSGGTAPVTAKPQQRSAGAPSPVTKGKR